MKVTPVKKKFGKYSPGDVFELPDNTAKVFIKVGKLREVVETAAPVYQTRMLQAEPVAAPAPSVMLQSNTDEADPAPYGYKADGTPRKRPGRTKASE